MSVGTPVALGAEFELFGTPPVPSNMILFHRQGATSCVGEAVLVDYEGDRVNGRPVHAEVKLNSFFDFGEIYTKILISNDWSKLLVVTHAHIDHHGNNLNSAIDARRFKLIMHRNTYDDLRSSARIVDFFGPVEQKQALDKTESHPSVIVIDGDDQITLDNGDVIDLIHVPNAHTRGDLIVHFVAQNCIVTGDILFSGQYPFIDHLNGGTFAGMIKGLQKILGLADSDTVIVPGHGEVAGRSAVEAALDMLTTISHRVHSLMYDGVELNDIVDIYAPTLDFDADWAKGLISPRRLVEQLHNERKIEMG